MSIGEKVVAQIRRQTGIPQQEPSELERAFQNYKDMEADCNRLRHSENELRIANGALMAEVAMLREAVERSDSDRIRLQGVTSTIMGQLMAINSVIADAVRLSIKNGVEAVEAAKPEEKAKLDEAGAQARDIIERVAPAAPTVTPPPNEYKR